MIQPRFSVGTSVIVEVLTGPQKGPRQAEVVAVVAVSGLDWYRVKIEGYEPFWATHNRIKALPQAVSEKLCS